MRFWILSDSATGRTYLRRIDAPQYGLRPLCNRLANIQSSQPVNLHVFFQFKRASPSRGCRGTGFCEDSVLQPFDVCRNGDDQRPRFFPAADCEIRRTLKFTLDPLGEPLGQSIVPNMPELNKRGLGRRSLRVLTCLDVFENGSEWLLIFDTSALCYHFYFRLTQVARKLFESVRIERSNAE